MRKYRWIDYVDAMTWMLPIILLCVILGAYCLEYLDWVIWERMEKMG